MEGVERPAALLVNQLKRLCTEVIVNAWAVLTPVTVALEARQSFRDGTGQWEPQIMNQTFKILMQCLKADPTMYSQVALDAKQSFLIRQTMTQKGNKALLQRGSIALP